MKKERGGTPSSISDAIRAFLEQSRIGSRIEQAEIVAAWPAVVGAQIAGVTEARGVSSKGVLLVYVKTNAWMTELSLREPEVLEAIRVRMPDSGITSIRWIRWP